MTEAPDPTKGNKIEQSPATAEMTGAEAAATGSNSKQQELTEKPETEPSASNSQSVAAEAISSSSPETAPGPIQQPPAISKEPAPPSPPAKNTDASPAIEAATTDDATKANPTTSKDEGPVCVITLLVTSGKKHPYKIDEKYLTKRNVPIPGTTESGHKDPFSISVYTLKELILREWREEWEPKPTSPTLIRLIHFGKLLADKDQLNQYKFSAETSNVVHMSVRPQEIVEEDEPKGTGKSGRDSRNPEDRGQCCVIL
jgi:hypothetical protein